MDPITTDINDQGEFDFGMIDILDVDIQFNLIGPYYAVIEEDNSPNSLYRVKNEGVNLYNPCGYPELWDHEGLINYRYQQFPVEEPEPFFYDEDIGLIWKKHNYDFCGGLHVLQQAMRFDSFDGISERDFFGIFVDTSIYYPLSWMLQGSCYQPSTAYGFDVVYIESEEPMPMVACNPDQWDNSLIFHELAHAYHQGHSTYNLTTMPDHSFQFHSDLPTAYCEGLAHYIGCVIKYETPADEWDTVIINGITYSDPEWITSWKIDNTGAFINHLVVSLETVNIPMYSTIGNICEGNVALFLWDQYDLNNDPLDNDRITFGFAPGWELFSNAIPSPIQNITEFLNVLYLTYVPFGLLSDFADLATNHDLSFIGNTDREIFQYPDDFPTGFTLQQAIDATCLGEYDIIMLEPGTYTESITINRPIYLTSEFYHEEDVSFIENTIIEGAITVHDDATFGSIIGLTLTNSNSIVINLQAVSYMLNNCYILNSQFGVKGHDSSAILLDCFVNNCATAIQLDYNWDPSQGKSAFVFNSEFSENGLVNNNDGGSYFENCTIVNNEVTGFGDNITELKNSIIWANTSNYNGSLLTINYCNIEGGYVGYGNIDEDPLFVDPQQGDYHLTVLSLCIDSGDPSLYLDPDETLSDMGCYYFHHDYDIKRFEEGIQWSSFPYLKEQGTSNGEIYEQAYWNQLAQTPGLLQETYQGDPTIDGFDIIYGKRGPEMYIDYIAPDFIDEGFGNMLFRNEGYKIQVYEGAEPSIMIVDGERLEYYELDMTVLENYWLGYYLPQPQNIEDAFGDYWVDVNKVWAEDWYYDRLNINRGGEPVSANSTKGKTLEYGKMYIVQMYDDITGFHWNGSSKVEAPSKKAETQYFTYTEKADYEAIDVVNIPPNVTEIGVLEEDVCVGAVVVEDSYAQILVYSDNANRDPSSFTFEIVNEGRFQLPIKNYEVFNWYTGEFESGIIISGMQEYSLVMLGEEGEPEVTPTITKIELHSNFPNPFNPSTTISFSLPKEKNIELTIYNIKGQKVKTLYSGIAEEGKHSMIWKGIDLNGKKVSSGIYFYKLETNNKELTRKMLLLK